MTITIDKYTLTRKRRQKFYKKYFGLIVNFKAVKIPEKPKGFSGRLLFIAKGTTPDFALKVCGPLFECENHIINLDEKISQNIRTPEKDHYAIWVHDDVFADFITLTQSTNDADPDMKIGITLLERIILEIEYFLQTGKHLDVKGGTFCSGSRCSSGNVPRTDFGFEKFSIMEAGLNDCGVKFGIRSVIC